MSFFALVTLFYKTKYDNITVFIVVTPFYGFAFRFLLGIANIAK